MADLFYSGMPAGPFLIRNEDRPCGHPGCGKSASFFLNATPLSTVIGRPPRFLQMWCGEHVPSSWLPGRKPSQPEEGAAA